MRQYIVVFRSFGGKVGQVSACGNHNLLFLLQTLEGSMEVVAYKVVADVGVIKPGWILPKDDAITYYKWRDRVCERENTYDDLV